MADSQVVLHWRRRGLQGAVGLAAALVVAAACAGVTALHPPGWVQAWTDRLPPSVQIWLARQRQPQDLSALPVGLGLEAARGRGVLVAAVRYYQRPAPPDAPLPPAPDGYDAALARYLAEQLGLRLELVSLEAAAQGAGFRRPRGGYDVAIAGPAALSGTLPVAVPQPGHASVWEAARLVVLRGSALQGPKDLRGQRVCVQRGSGYAAAVASVWGAEPAAYPSGVHAVSAFMAGECAALAEDESLLQRLAQQPEWRFYRLLPQGLPADDSLPPLALALDDAAGRAFVDAVLRQWRTSGRHDAARAQRVGDVAFEVTQLADGLVCHA